MARRVRCTPYRVAWMPRRDLSSVAYLPKRACLDMVVRLCREFDTEAEMYDKQGFRRAWVHSDGNYTLKR